ncbi:hypothetical protein MRX96_026129 [Rhipicephalus microplus]
MLATPETPPHEPLFEKKTSKKKDTLLETELSMVEEQLAAASLGTSTPLQLSPERPRIRGEFHDLLYECSCFGTIQQQRLVSFDPSCGYSAQAIENGATGLHASDRATDGNLDSTPPPPLPALGESFVITRESPTTDRVALDASPTTEATFAISDILPAETTASLAKMDAIIIGAGSLEQSSKSAALAVGTLASEPLPVLGESFTVAGSQATDTEASNGLAMAETTFAVIPDAPPVETAVKEARACFLPYFIATPAECLLLLLLVSSLGEFSGLLCATPDSQKLRKARALQQDVPFVG